MELQNKGPTILGVMWATTSTAMLFVAARIYTRGKILKKLGLDDYLIGLSMILGLVFVGLSTSAVHYGNGRHSETLTRNQFEKAAMLNTAGFAPGILSFVVPKLGVVALLIRLFNPPRPRKIFLWSFVGGSCIIISGCIVIIYAQCSPVRALWTLDLNSSRCWSPWILVNYSLFAGSLSAFLDLFLAIYPGVVMWKLQIAQRKKIGLITAFSLGACAAVVSMYKCTRIPGLADESDSTYSTADLVIWTNVESNAIIIAACIPTIIPLVDKSLQKRKTYLINNAHRSGHFELQSPRPRRHPQWETSVGASTCPRPSMDHDWGSNGIIRTQEITIHIE